LISYIIRRLAQVVLVMLAVSLLVFAMLLIAPGDPASVLAGEDATQEDIEAIKAKFGLDQPVHVRYGIWLGRVLKGDLGRSIVTRRPVSEEIFSRLPLTAELAAAALIIAIAGGMLVGIVSAVYQYSMLDHITMIISLLGVSTPSFWLGLMLIFFFAVRLRWFPIGGGGSLSALILPALSLGISSAANIARMTRSSLLEVIRQDYVRTARAKGLSERTVLMRHTLKNAMIPIVTVIGLRFGYLLGGAVITETVFARPGLGRLLVDGIRARDFPAVQGTIMLLSASFVIVNLLVDVTYAYLDPRIHYE